MSRLPVPLADRQQRLALAGNLRFGVKVPGSKGPRPKALDTWVFSSQQRDDVDAAAQLYGGTVEAWSEPKTTDRWRVITEATEIEVALPGIGCLDLAYELFGGQGCIRRCDGMEAEVARKGPEGHEWVPEPCICRARNLMECKGKARLTVLVPQLSLRGAWRLTTGSEAALDELPASVEVIRAAGGGGMVRAVLRLERRQTQGGRNKFVVPVLGVAESLEQVMAGEARMVAIEGPGPQDVVAVGEVLELEAGETLAQHIASMAPGNRELLKLWWRDVAKLPPIDRLSAEQEAYVHRVIDDGGYELEVDYGDDDDAAAAEEATWD